MATSEPTSYDNDFEHLDNLKHSEPSIQKLINLIVTKLSELAKDAQKELNEALIAITTAANLDGIENKQLRSENKHLLKRLDELKEKKSEMESKCRDELYNLRRKINEQEKEICKLKTNRPEERTYAKLGDIEDAVKWKLEFYDTVALKLRQTQGKLRETGAEPNATKTRLSESMGDEKLTDNNSSIADLSDNNRSSKLAEKFQELYDNQWTDAFEIVYTKCIQGDSEHEEKRTAAKLINILMRNRNTHISTNVDKQIKVCRRNVADFSGKQLFQKYQENLQSSSSSRAVIAKSIPGFLEECFNICWLMTVHDPPLAFGPNIEENGLIQIVPFKIHKMSYDQERRNAYKTYN